MRAHHRIIQQDWISKHPGNIDDVSAACTRWLQKRGIECNGLRGIIKDNYRIYQAEKKQIEREQQENERSYND